MMLGVLLKKQLTEATSVFRRGKRNVDYVGILIYLALIAVVLYVIVAVFSQLVLKYCEIRIDGVLDIRARQFELVTIIYETLFFVGVLSALVNLCNAIFESDDRKILSTLPIKSSSLFLSKLIFVYARECVACMVCLIPLNMTFAAVTSQSAYYIVMSVLFCFMLPILTIAVASVFCLPAYYLKRFVQNKYTIVLIVATAGLGVVFWGYSRILDFLQALMTTGEIKFFFSERTMNIIISTTGKLYPACVFSNILLGNNIAKNIGLFVAFAVPSLLIAFFLVRALYTRALEMRAGSNGKVYISGGLSKRKHSHTVTLLKKEFDQIIRTPSYAVQYFSVAAIMPLMVYFCIGIGTDLMTTLVFTENSLELAVMLTAVFGVLTNTFCATNISRDGTAFYMMKTLPFSCREIVFAKVLFSATISTVAVATTAILLSATGYLTAAQGTFVFITIWMLTTAQICLATRMDLNHPRFSTEEDNEVKESNTTVSVIVVIGLLSAFVLGGVPLGYNVFAAFGKVGFSGFTYLFVGLTSVLMLVASIAYLCVEIERTYGNLTEGD